MPPATDALEATFERAPVLVDRLRLLVPPGTAPEAVIAATRGVVASLDEPARIGILDAHPRIGADAATLSALSRREQGAAAADTTAADLARLNDEYELRFGFRFVVFVNGRSKQEIVQVLRERLRRTRDEELLTGVEQFLAISLDRLRRAERAS